MTMSAIDVLSKVSGLKPSDIKDIAAQVKANQTALNACNGHDFTGLTPELSFNKKYRCKNCGGTVDSHALYWYQLGRKHQGGHV